MSQELININVIVADRPYRLKIKPQEEETVRQAAKSINDKLKEFSSQYGAKDKQDYLAMVTILFAVEALNARKKHVVEDPAVTEKLAALNTLLDNVLANE